MTTAADIQSAVLESLDDAQAKDVISLDVRNLTDVTDYMVVCSGTSNRHLHSIVDKLLEHLKNINQRPIGVEGADSNEWILVDYGDVVVHVMLPEVREFYSLEKLWANTEKARQAHEN